MVMVCGGRVRLRSDLVSRQGLPMFLTGLVGDLADQRGLLRLDAAASSLYFGVRRALAASPRLGGSRSVSGDVIPDEHAGGATHRSTCFTGDGPGCRNREISTDEMLRRTGVASPFDRSRHPACENGGSQNRSPGSGLLHGSLHGWGLTMRSTSLGG